MILSTIFNSDGKPSQKQDSQSSSGYGAMRRSQKAFHKQRSSEIDLMAPRPMTFRAETSPSPRGGSNMGVKATNNYNFEKFERAVGGVHGKVTSPSNPLKQKKDLVISVQARENNDNQNYGVTLNDPLRASTNREKFQEQASKMLQVNIRSPSYSNAKSLLTNDDKPKIKKPTKELKGIEENRVLNRVHTLSGDNFYRLDSNPSQGSTTDRKTPILGLLTVGDVTIKTSPNLRSLPQSVSPKLVMGANKKPNDKLKVQEQRGDLVERIKTETYKDRKSHSKSLQKKPKEEPKQIKREPSAQSRSSKDKASPLTKQISIKSPKMDLRESNLFKSISIHETGDQNQKGSFTSRAPSSKTHLVLKDAVQKTSRNHKESFSAASENIRVLLSPFKKNRPGSKFDPLSYKRNTSPQMNDLSSSSGVKEGRSQSSGSVKRINFKKGHSTSREVTMLSDTSRKKATSTRGKKSKGQGSETQRARSQSHGRPGSGTKKFTQNTISEMGKNTMTVGSVYFNDLKTQQFTEDGLSSPSLTKFMVSPQNLKYGTWRTTNNSISVNDKFGIELDEKTREFAQTIIKNSTDTGTRRSLTPQRNSPPRRRGISDGKNFFKEKEVRMSSDNGETDTHTKGTRESFDFEPFENSKGPDDWPCQDDEKSPKVKVTECKVEIKEDLSNLESSLDTSTKQVKEKNSKKSKNKVEDKPSEPLNKALHNIQLVEKNNKSHDSIKASKDNSIVSSEAERKKEKTTVKKTNKAEPLKGHHDKLKAEIKTTDSNFEKDESKTKPSPPTPKKKKILNKESKTLEQPLVSLPNQESENIIQEAPLIKLLSSGNEEMKNLSENNDLKPQNNQVNEKFVETEKTAKATPETSELQLKSQEQEISLAIKNNTTTSQSEQSDEEDIYIERSPKRVLSKNSSRDFETLLKIAETRILDKARQENLQPDQAMAQYLKELQDQLIYSGKLPIWMQSQSLPENPNREPVSFSKESQAKKSQAYESLESDTSSAADISLDNDFASVNKIKSRKLETVSSPNMTSEIKLGNLHSLKRGYIPALSSCAESIKEEEEELSMPCINLAQESSSPRIRPSNHSPRSPVCKFVDVKDFWSYFTETSKRIDKLLENQETDLGIKLMRELLIEIDLQEETFQLNQKNNERRWINSEKGKIDFKELKVRIGNKLGAQLYAKGQYVEALEELDKVLEIDPLSIQALYKSHEAHFKLNNRKEARLILKRIKESMQTPTTKTQNELLPNPHMAPPLGKVNYIKTITEVDESNDAASDSNHD